MTHKKTDIELQPKLSPIELARYLEELDERRLRQVDLAAAKSTREAYAFDMRQFETWCAEHGARPLPCTPNVLGIYLAHLERLGRKPNTISRKLAAIVRHHKAGDHPSPRNALVTEQMKGIRRGEVGSRPDPVKEAPPISTHELVKIVRAMESSPATHRDLVLRDKAAILIGWSCAMRRSEIAALEIGDAEHTRQGWQIWIRRSKTDKTGKGIALALAPAERNKDLCPVDALEAWLEARRGAEGGKQPEGALFWKSNEQREHRTTLPKLIPGEAMPWNQVNRMVRRWSRAAELESSNGHPFSPHSLRAGFITEAIMMGRPIANTKERSRHVSMDVFFKYVRIAMTFENNVQKGLL
jgi:integrase